MQLHSYREGEPGPTLKLHQALVDFLVSEIRFGYISSIQTHGTLATLLKPNFQC
jgi:hypothetical protein